MGAGFFKQRRFIMLAIACICIATCTAGGAFAYLTAGTDPLSNQFVPAKVTCAVEEVFENGVKEDVRVRNTGNIHAYIRAAVVATFVAEDGKVLATAPKETVDYTVKWGTSGWVKGSDGYWYYTQAVAPDGLTAKLIESATAISVPDGYRLHLQIIATAIQSAPEQAVVEAWGVTLTDGTLVPN